MFPQTSRNVAPGDRGRHEQPLRRALRVPERKTDREGGDGDAPEGILG